MSAMCVQTLLRKWRSCEITINVPVITAKEVLEPVDRVEVQVVGRLVQQQRAGASIQRLREQHAHLLSALQLAHRPLVERVGDVEPLQQHGGVAFSRVAVLVADDAFELAEAHAVLVGHVGLRIQRVALGQRVPQPLVAHDDGVDHAEGVEGELILAEDAELWTVEQPCRAAARFRR